MLFNLLEQAVDSAASLGEKAGDGAITFVIGMGVIFLGMTILILCVTGFGKIADAIARKAEKKSEAASKSEAPSVTESAPADEGIPEDIRVAIIAAVSAYYTESGSKNEFKVKKIKKL